MTIIFILCLSGLSKYDFLFCTQLNLILKIRHRCPWNHNSKQDKLHALSESQASEAETAKDIRGSLTDVVSWTAVNTNAIIKAAWLRGNAVEAHFKGFPHAVIEKRIPKCSKIFIIPHTAFAALRQCSTTFTVGSGGFFGLVFFFLVGFVWWWGFFYYNCYILQMHKTRQENKAIRYTLTALSHPVHKKNTKIKLKTESTRDSASYFIYKAKVILWSSCICVFL